MPLPRRPLLLFPLALLKARNVRDLAGELALIYGHELPTVTYIPAIACLARLRLEPKSLPELERLAAPFGDGRQDSLAALTASHISGHLLFTALYRRTRRPAYLERARAAAAAVTFELYNEMSDGYFMGLPLLAEVYALTGEAPTLAKLIEHFGALESMCRRDDGLYRHSPLSDAAWGRGNAFVLLGLALAIEALPPKVPARQSLANAYTAHARALLRFQTNNGLWRQLVDVDTAWEEYSATAMIATALRKGARLGLLPEVDIKTAVQEAFIAVDARTKPGGVLLDVCESTGKQTSFEAYLSRRRSQGRDARGGAMALLLASELLAH